MLLHVRILSFQIRKGLCLTCRSGFPWSPTNTKLGRKEDFNIVVRAVQVPFRAPLRIQILSKRGENMKVPQAQRGTFLCLAHTKKSKKFSISLEVKRRSNFKNTNCYCCQKNTNTKKNIEMTLKDFQKITNIKYLETIVKK